MESTFARLEADLGEQRQSYGDAKHDLFNYFEIFFNRQRKHSMLSCVSPVGLERSATMAVAA